MGWLLCNGSEVNREEYRSLFIVINIIYGGGDGIYTFNLPDLRGRVLVGVGQGLTLTNRQLGATFGTEQHTLTVNQMPSHSHGVNDPGHQHEIGDGSRGQRWGINDGGSKWVFGIDHRDFQNNPLTVRAQTGVSIQPTGSNEPHNNMQPAIAINYIIKY
jgi:microcystin-dependent protein